jgi:hypothetical protein
MATSPPHKLTRNPDNAHKRASAQASAVQKAVNAVEDKEFERTVKPQLGNIGIDHKEPGNVGIEKIRDRTNSRPSLRLAVSNLVIKTKATLAEAIDELLIRAKREAPELVAPLAVAARLAKGEVTRLPDPPERLSKAQLAEFRAYAKANPWSAKHRFTASYFIEHHYQKWLGRKDGKGNWIGPALWREDIVDVEPKLAAAYATEVRRHPYRSIPSLYVRPHKLPEGITRTVSSRLVSELGADELARKREIGRTRTRKWRERTKNTPDS